MKSLSRIIKVNDQNPVASEDLKNRRPYSIKPRTKSSLSFDDDSSIDLSKYSKEKQEEIAVQIVEKARKQAALLVADAKTEALAIVRDHKERAEQDYAMEMGNAHKQGLEAGMEEGRRLGFQSGYEYGFEKGNEEAMRICSEKLKFMHSVIEGIDDGRHNLLVKYQDDLKDVAFAIAEKIVRREISMDPELIKEITENAAQMCKNQDYLRISLSPNSYKLMVGDKELEERLSAFSNDIRFISDSKLNDGDCIIETPLGVIDAGIGTQFENIQNEVNDEGILNESD